MRKKQIIWSFIYPVCVILLLQTLMPVSALAQTPKDYPEGSIINKIVFMDTSEINAGIEEAISIREEDFTTAEIIYQRALTASKRLGYTDGVARSLIGLGKTYSLNSQNKKAIAFTREAIKYCADNTGGHERLASIYMQLSEVYYYNGHYDSCAYYRYAALSELDNNKVQNPMLQLRVYCSILQFWLNVNDDIKSDSNIKQVVERINRLEQTALAAKDSNALVFIYFHKAGYYNNIGKNDSARIYCNKHLELGKTLKVSPSMSVATLMNIGLTYMDENNTSQALYYIDKAVNSIPGKGRSSNRYYIFGNIFLGEVYLKQHEYQKAIAITEPALEMANKINLLNLVPYAYKTLAEAYEITGNYKKAQHYQKQYSVIRDSMIKVQKLEIMYDMEMKYQISDKNKELAQKELAIARNESRIKSKNLLIGGISAGLVLILLISLLVYRNHHHKERLQTEKIRNLHQEVQITSLRSVITGEEKERSRIARDLHDGMGGTLAAIRTQLSAIFRKHKTSDVNDDFLEVMELLDEASADLRKTAHNLMPEILLQEGLAKATRLFCERVSKGHSLEIIYETWGKNRPLAGDIELTAYRIIQELINNILKHAGATQALVQIVFHDSQLCITVEDNGRGIPEIANGKEGVGLQTIRERVKLLNGQIDIAGKPGKGTSVYIELTIATSKQNTAEI